MKIKKVMRKPVMMGVVRIWTRWSRGPPVGIVEFESEAESSDVDDGDAAEEEEEAEGRVGNGRS
jgi:hypothetical protein